MNLFMRWSRNDNPLPCNHSGADVRRAGRLRCNMLVCSYGEVLDLSSAGMRVRHKGRPRIRVGDAVALMLFFASAEVRLDTRVIWMRRTGFRRYEIGFEFCNVSPEGRECLLEIARCAVKLAGFHPEAA